MAGINSRKSSCKLHSVKKTTGDKRGKNHDEDNLFLHQFRRLYKRVTKGQPAPGEKKKKNLQHVDVAH